MKNISKDEVIPVLRQIAQLFKEEKGFSEYDLSKAKNLATRLYILHTNRDITLNQKDFSLVIQILEYEI